MKYIYSDHDTRGGVPCIKDTRMPISILLANLAEGMTAEEFADDYGYKREIIYGVLTELSLYFNQPKVL